MARLTLDEVRAGGKRALARALAAIETDVGSDDLVALLDEAAARPLGRVVGLTGPPGVGKSTLTHALVRRMRAQAVRVAVAAIDPSSRVSGGALLGDRARIATDPGDAGVFIRSMAARDRLGGLSDQTVAAVAMMRALYERTLVESVGVGQSEADVTMVADTVVLCIQPGSGDSLQFMKAGVMETPDVIVVTKADLGEPAWRAKADVEGALTLAARTDPAWSPPVIPLSAADGSGLDALDAALDAHWAHLAGARLAARRAAQSERWVAEAIRARFGGEGLRAAGTIGVGGGPFSRERDVAKVLSHRLFG